MGLFPDIQSLAAASRQDVLKAWEHMGYYARVRNLHAAARKMVTSGNEKMPDTWDELIGLPGIGPYTAAAVLCFAFGKRLPTVDGNVRRVLSRLFLIEDPINQPDTQRNIYDLADDLVPKEDPGAFNQGLMDLGSMICKPRKPLCAHCPFTTYCKAHQKGMQEDLPRRNNRRKIPHKEMTAGIINGKAKGLLIVQRPEGGLLGGLWKFPGGEKYPEETLKHALRRNIKEEIGIGVRIKKELVAVRHAYTHFRTTLHVFRCDWLHGEFKKSEGLRWKWVETRLLLHFPFSKIEQKIIDILP
ncbi:A/G-specific adenine glycosylase [Thermodesulfobacteriota bacterium]